MHKYLPRDELIYRRNPPQQQYPHSHNNSGNLN